MQLQLAKIWGYTSATHTTASTLLRLRKADGPKKPFPLLRLFLKRYILPSSIGGNKLVLAGSIMCLEEYLGFMREESVDDRLPREVLLGAL